SLGFSGVGEAGASSGELNHGMMIPVSHSSPSTITIGAGGIGTSGSGSAGGNPGGSTSAGSFSVLGPTIQDAIPHTQPGGGPGGAAINSSDDGQAGFLASQESPTHFGGYGGGAGAA